MKFHLFSTVQFEVADPLKLIESYCFQTDFYQNFDCLLYKGKRAIADVNKIGARLSKDLLDECANVIDNKQYLPIFNYSLDSFLNLDNETINQLVSELDSKILGELIKISGIKLSTGTKILHTMYPEIIPMIDSLLQDEYRSLNIDSKSKEKWPVNILIDYYQNLKIEDNRRNLEQLFTDVSKSNLCLKKLRIFDILWWSYLRAKQLKKDRNIEWTVIKTLTA